MNSVGDLANSVGAIGTRVVRLEMRADSLEKDVEKIERLVWRFMILLGSIGGGSTLILIRYVLETAGIMP